MSNCVNTNKEMKRERRADIDKEIQAFAIGAIIATLASAQERLATLVTAWEREDLDTTHITSTAGVSANVAIANAIFCIEEQEKYVTEERKSRKRGDQ